MADEFRAGKAPGDPLTRHALAELAHGPAVDNADFGSPYQDAPRSTAGHAGPAGCGGAKQAR